MTVSHTATIERTKIIPRRYRRRRATSIVTIRRMRALLIVTVVASCGPPAAAPRTATGVPAETLEADLARLPQDTSPGSTIQRSRVLRALGRQPQAVAQLET